MGYARAGRDADAIREFKAAIPILMAGTRETDADDPTLVAARSARLQRMVEAYIGVLAREPNPSNDVAVETFALADAVRGHAVEQALADSSARMVAKDPALADLVRSEQDAAKQLGAQLGALNNLLALPSDQRDDQTVRAVNAEIVKLRADRNAALQEITRQFPTYANLIDPKPPTADEIKAALRPGEALLSFYFGQDASFVWAVPKDGAVAFAAVPLTAIELEAKVRRLRQALEPQVTSVSDIPPFDLTLAYELYTALLKPVEAGWHDAKRLDRGDQRRAGRASAWPIADGALADRCARRAAVRRLSQRALAGAQPRGDGDSRRIGADHAAPSAAGFAGPRTVDRIRRPLFQCPAGRPKRKPSSPRPRYRWRPPAILRAAVTRGIPLKLRAAPHTEDVDVAELSMLPRLAGHAPGIDFGRPRVAGRPRKGALSGQDRPTSRMSRRWICRITAFWTFATHGLVPGDIDGLTQPALALTAPDIAGVKGDGLLTMSKILALKLDADWVVLSACNTAAGAGAGAEAASGLGSAFFYAGTRALLVTNWSVHSESARRIDFGSVPAPKCGSRRCRAARRYGKR